ncbi:L-2-hydroxyglutarate oxidase LhgO [Maioricimonas rarisocia]|uniref:L-2-hydroxyglutarate oxidase LhgO n=1 Tax=Maioricimonas rarisocia TaxID=2528026 RepID=A0A517Z7G0_9PLAN|nr:L-2-hydroxyglutarate oxidase [Maioricimonas rarisocia]QDU38384.1 L-2-hydroxyglutarate oxidase LhgO [Maioricimonas rarisocia]
MTDSFQTDVAIIGGGIVGLATAWRLQQRHPDRRVTVVEKESGVAAHQSGHNSGVLHSGIYYRPGSLRATNCRAGKLAMQEFCQEYGIPFDICGKVIVAVDEQEIPRLKKIFERGQANGVDCRMIDANRLHELEPHVAGVMAIQVPEAGIVDYKQVCEKLAELIRQQGGTIRFDSRVEGVQVRNGAVHLETRTGDVEAKHLVTCAGLQADRVARMTGHPLEANIVPFRGEYFELKPDVQHLCRNLIYPVPDPSFPFLGVHFTRMIHGGVECGPNAVLAFAREGYTKSDINLRDLAGTLTYPGFLRLAAKYWKTGAGEMWRSMCKAAFVRALQRLIPEIRSEHLVAAPAGVRAQALGRHGEVLDDFVIQESERVINVGNAPSPAATASLNIGNLIVDRLEPRFK